MGTKDVNGVKTSLKPVNGKIATLTKDVNALKPVNGKIATLTKDVSGVKASLKPVNGKIAKLTGRIAALEKHLDEIGGGFAAQSAPMDVLDYNNAPRDAFGGNSDLVIISLVIFNIGTVLACVSCLYWNKKARGVEIFDELEK